MRKFHQAPAGVCTAVVLIALAGCSGAEKAGSTLQGVVKFNGEPLPDAVVQFFPKSGTGSSAQAVTNAAGEYEAAMSRSLTGIRPGDYKVTVSGRVGDKQVPAAYASAETSILEISVPPNQDVVKDIEIAADAEDYVDPLAVEEPDDV